MKVNSCNSQSTALLHLGSALNREEIQALLDAPDPSCGHGLRDRAMFHLAYAGGLRVSELVGLRLADLTLSIPNRPFM